MASIAPRHPPRVTRFVRGRMLGQVLVETIVPTTLVALWWFVSRHSTSVYFPSLSSIVDSLRQFWLFAHFGSDAVPSLEHLAIGFLISTAVGVVVGVAIGLARVLDEAIAPILEFLRAVPGVALLPAAVLLLGIGSKMEIGVIVYGTIWPILLNTIDGVRSIDPQVAEVARSYRINLPNRLWRIVLPAASPQIVAGMRTALSIGITLIVFSEMVGATNGIGYQILAAQRDFDITDMWAGMLLLGVIGYLLNVGFRGFEHVVLRWHRGARGVTT